MVANCLKLQTKSWMKEKKEEYINKEKKKTGHTKPVDLWDPQI